MYEDDAPRERVDDDEEYVDAMSTRDRKPPAKEEKYRRQAGIVAQWRRWTTGKSATSGRRSCPTAVSPRTGTRSTRTRGNAFATSSPRRWCAARDRFAPRGTTRAARGEASGIKTSVTKSRKFGA